MSGEERETSVDSLGEEKKKGEAYQRKVKPTSFYVPSEQLRHLDELTFYHNRRTGQRINRNDVVRHLIAKARLEDLDDLVEVESGPRQLIGMLIPSFTWPLIPELMRGVAEVLQQTSYELMLYSIDDADLKRDRSAVINRVLMTQMTAGLLAVFPGAASKELTRIYNQGFPVVIIDDQLEQTTPWVGVDNTAGAYTAVQHLIKLGHKRIAHIAGPNEYLASHDRYNGYRKALLEAGITPDPELVLEGDFLPQGGRACATKLFELPQAKRPTAIFTATDQMAYGVIAAAEEYGLSIPRDVALVGFDDDTPSAHVHPPLTTIRQPYYDMGAQGLKLLLSLLDSSSKAKPIRVQLPTSLVVRVSCGANYQIPVSTSIGKDVL